MVKKGQRMMAKILPECALENGRLHGFFNQDVEDFLHEVGTSS